MTHDLHSQECNLMLKAKQIAYCTHNAVFAQIQLSSYIKAWRGMQGKGKATNLQLQLPEKASTNEEFSTS